MVFRPLSTIHRPMSAAANILTDHVSAVCSLDNVIGG